MVSRQESGNLTEFVALVTDVTYETDAFRGTRQYHLHLAPKDIKVTGPSGEFHEWIPLSAKANEDSIPAGSVLDRYLQMVEAQVPGADKAKTVKEAFLLMKGKTFKFKKMKLGRDFEGNKAKEYSTPIALVQ